MFYAHFILTKKGPLARIWLAAHWDKKLTKAHVFETNIESSVKGILQPKINMALRTSSHLLLGIVRIYSRKAKYLLADCNEAIIKINIAFRPYVVDLPEGHREVAISTITLHEVFHDFDHVIPDISMNLSNPGNLNQSRAEDITLREDYGTLTLMAEDGFGDADFDVPEMARNATNIDEGFDRDIFFLRSCNGEQPNNTLINTSKCSDDSVLKSFTINSSKNLKVNLEVSFTNNGINGILGNRFSNEAENVSFGSTGLFDDAPLGNVPIDNICREERIEQQNVSVTHKEELTKRPADGCDKDNNNVQLLKDQNIQHGLELNVSALPVSTHNEEEEFSLKPTEAVLFQDKKKIKSKGKRKLIIDAIKNLPGKNIKSQLYDTADIITALDLAPPTKKLMHWKETGQVGKLFTLPDNHILSETLLKLYQHHLTTQPVQNESFHSDEDGRDQKDVCEKFRKRSLATKLRKRKRCHVNGSDFLEQAHEGTSPCCTGHQTGINQTELNNIQDISLLSLGKLDSLHDISLSSITTPESIHLQVEPSPEPWTELSPEKQMTTPRLSEVRDFVKEQEYNTTNVKSCTSESEVNQLMPVEHHIIANDEEHNRSEGMKHMLSVLQQCLRKRSKVPFSILVNKNKRKHEESRNTSSSK